MGAKPALGQGMRLTATFGQLLQQPAMFLLVSSMHSSAAACMASLCMELCKWCCLAGPVIMREAIVPPLLKRDLFRVSACEAVSRHFS